VQRSAKPEELENPSLSRHPGWGRWYVLGAGVFWSLSGVLTKSLPLDPLTIALFRGLLAGAALVPFVPARHWPVRIRKASIAGQPG
jgi:drug/metabolite transporter (DMT)-like permease